MTILVTGGAGYIGSHTTYALLDRGEDVVVLDNLSTGLRALVSDRAVFVQGAVEDKVLVREIMATHGIYAVIHFAGSIVVPESVAKPLRYYANNVGAASRILIETCVEEGVKNFIFSLHRDRLCRRRRAAPVRGGMRPRNPISPYARSKLMTEWMLEDTARAHDFRYIVLRYFNVAGALTPKAARGQSSPDTTHLIKRATMAALGRISHPRNIWH